MLLPNEPSYFTPDQLDRLLVFCCQHGASDINFQTGEPVIIETEGTLKALTSRALSLQESSDLINYIYGPNATALLARGQDIDTSYLIKHSESQQSRYRVNATACYFDGYQGIQTTLRVISSEPPALTSLGIGKELLNKIKVPQGIVVVSGATGSGKSTLLAAMIADIAKRVDSHCKILTYESPIEYVYDKVVKQSAMVSQTEIPRYLPNFAAGVRNALRRKPGLILVGEARDQETIEAVIDAALTGHPVYTTVHSNGVADTLRRMVTSFSFAERDARLLDLLETTKVIIWQALVPAINGGRIALREYLEITPQVRDLLAGTPAEHLVAKLRSVISQFGCSIADDARTKYQQGLIEQAIYRRFSVEVSDAA